MDNLVDSYFDKILKESRYHSNQSEILNNTNAIKKQLQIIVDNKLEYLLTDSLINYISRDSLVSLSLYQLHNSQEERISLISSYFEEMCLFYKDQIIYFDLLDKDIKSMVIKASYYSTTLYKNYNNYHYRLYDIERIIYVIMAYCFINNKIDEFNNICNIFLTNPYQTLDDLYINDIRNPQGVYYTDTDEALYNRVITRIESNNKRTIK